MGIGTSSPDRLLHSYSNNSNTNTSGILPRQTKNLLWKRSCGTIQLTGGDIDITAGRTLDMISDDEMYLESRFNRFDLKSGMEMKFNAGGRLFGMAGTDIKLDAGLNLDFDGSLFDRGCD